MWFTCPQLAGNPKSSVDGLETRGLRSSSVSKLMTLHLGQRVPGFPKRAFSSKLHAPLKNGQPQGTPGAPTKLNQPKRDTDPGNLRTLLRNTVPQGCTARLFRITVQGLCTGTRLRNTVLTDKSTIAGKKQ